MKTRTTLVAAALSLVAGGGLRADPIDDYLRQEMKARQIPGLGIAIARDGEIVRLSSYGLANVETATPVAEGSIFAIASLDKQITAAGVLRAAERGLLTLDERGRIVGGMDERGLSLSLHGLRKALARRLAEAGATPQSIMAVMGHSTIAMAAHYSAAYDRGRAADMGLEKLGSATESPVVRLERKRGDK